MQNKDAKYHQSLKDMGLVRVAGWATEKNKKLIEPLLVTKKKLKHDLAKSGSSKPKATHED